MTTLNTRPAPRHGGNRSTVLGDIATTIRYFFRIAFPFSSRDHAAFAESVTLFGAR